MVELDQMVLTTRTWGSDPAEIVLLHDGLGSISQWRDLPDKIASQTGKTVLAYDRAGHGSSLPTPSGPWPEDWMAREAVVLGLLLEALNIERPILIAHSDGGSIALIHAANEPGQPRALVLLAAHSFVEMRCTDAIAELRGAPAGLLAALGRHHDDAAAVFEAWSGGWLRAAFQDWDIRPLLARVECPVMVVQGSEDEYATNAMFEGTVGAFDSALVVEGQLLPGVRHGLHRENADQVVKLVVDFVKKATSNSPSS